MIIKSIELTHFGKFHGKKMENRPGLNVFAAQNEAGKTTIHAFIRGMFYGIERGRGRASKEDRYLHYEPWENAGAYEGKLRFEKNGVTYRIERSFLKTNRYLRLYDETNGVELTPAEEQLNRLLEGMTESSFINTISIEQLRSATDKELIAELRNFAINMGNTRSTSIDMTRSKHVLRKKKKEFQGKLLPEADKELSVAEQKYEQICAKSMALMEERDRLEREFGAKNNQLQGDISQMKLLRASRETEYKDLGNQLQEKYEERNAYADNRKGLWLTAGIGFGVLALIVLIGLVCSMASVQIPFFSRFWPFVALFVLLICVVGLVIQSQRWKKTLKEMDGEIKRMQADQEALQTDTTVSQGELSCENLLQQVQEISDSRNRAEWELEALLKEQREQEGRLQELYEQTEQNEKYRQEITAIDLALKKFDILTEKIHDTFGVRLNQAASDYFAQITEGKYTDLKIDDNMNIYVNTPDRLIPIEQCSRGTIEQIYLCIRLAASGILSPKESMPVVLDDVFAYYDNERLAETLKILRRMKNQVIVFTCHTRESSWVKQQKKS